MSISISMFDVMADWMNMPLLAHRYMGGAPKRNGMKHTFIAPYGTFKCKNNDEVREVGVEWGKQQTKELIEFGAPCIHFYTMGKSDNVQQIVGSFV